MSAPRGRGGGGVRGNNTPSRGASWRGKGNGFASQNNSERPAQQVYTPRGQRGQRGGLPRGGPSQRGNQSARGSPRGRGGNSNVFGSQSTSTPNSTPFGQGDYKKRLDHIKNARPSIREQFIKDGLMNPEGQMRLSDSVKLIGICTDMCPEFERVRRIVENDVKPPECTPETEHLPRADRIPDESRMVKAYARSAAGMDVELVSEIRSPATCLRTIDYLIQRLDSDDFQYLQNWIWDRTRAVRKDLRTQRIEKRPDINILLTCLERTARFHLVSMHHMARSTKEDYSHQQDLEQLNQTLMSLRERYTDNRRANIPSENEAEFWAYRLILAPQYANNQLENELHRLPSDLRHNNRVKIAIEIFQLLKSVIITPSKSFVQCQANWKKLWDLIKSPKVSYLMACAAEVSFNRVRHVVLDCLWRAYRKGNSQRTVVVEDWTTDKLKDVLGLDTDKEAVKLCEDFGFVFSLNSAGQTFLDITKKGYAHQVLESPAGLKPQTFSAQLVESKRHDRAFSAVIQGLSVQQARMSGLVIDAELDMQVGEEIEDENSLFIPEPSSAPANNNIFSQQLNGKAPAADSAASTPLNPFASPFQPVSTPAVAKNPFLKAASQLQPNQDSSGFTPPSIQPGMFNASKNSILFAPPGSVTNTPISNASKAPSTPANPFLKKESAPQTPLSNPFARFATQQPEQSAATTTPTASTSTFPVQDSNGTTPQGRTQAGFSFTPSGLPPQEITASHDAERQKADQEKQEAAEKQRREEEARRKAQEAQRARAAQEAEQCRRQAEAEAEQQRQRQLQLDRERQMREEQERRAREMQQRQAQEEEARRARLREQESALHALTADVMFDPEQGLMMQFIENAAINIAEEAMVREEWRKKKILANEMYQRYQLMLKRAAMAKIITWIEKKKRVEHVRERRRRLKAQRAQMANMEEGDKDEISMTTDVVTMNNQSNGDSTYQRPAAPANARRARRTEERRRGQFSQQNGVSKKVARPNDATQAAVMQTAITPVKATNGNHSVVGYSEAYQRSTAPIDRTETDWFKLRAMGIDPSKHRKRSFDSTSEEEEEVRAEVKRAKLSPPKNDNRKLPPATTAEDQLARFRAVQQAFRKSATSPPQPAHGNTSVNGPLSLSGSSNNLIAKARELAANTPTSALVLQPINGAIPVNGTMASDGKSSLLIAKARELVAKSPTLETQPANSQHDWGRSVPVLGLSASLNSRSAFGSSTGASDTNNRPAYWERASRFVPRHLYGKGPEAIRTYHDQHKKSPSSSIRPASTEPATDPSLTPNDYSLQQGYVQEQHRQQPYSEEGRSDAKVIDVNAEDENAIMTEEEEEEDEQQDSDDDVNGPPPYLGRGYWGPQYQDEDSDMADTEEDEVEEEDGFAPAQYEQGHVQAQDEEVYEDYDEYTGEEDDAEEDEEDEEDGEGDSHQHFAQPAAHRFGHPSTQPPTKPAPQQQQVKQAGTTEDDAIELSD
ncbi:Nn.00g069360.m01.CDS01 [Neocucurbitaria sp. VM-36]